MAKKPSNEPDHLEGKAAPDFTLPYIAAGMEEEADFSIANHADKTLIIFFYPKDNTSGCTAEAIEFTEKQAEFEKLGAIVFGISPNPIKMHKKFIAKHNLSVPLIADEEKVMLDAYGTWIEKSMYGRKYMGVERSTFIIQNGTIVKAWRKVKVPGHVDTVLGAL
jgi:peroxiredoxin Q/BCP